MSAQSEKIARQLETALADVKSELATRLLAKLRERTPVRTGLTRSHWTSIAIGSAIDIDNDQGDTIRRLNDGSSRQAPAGFIEQAIDETLAEMQLEVGRPVKL